MPKIRTSRSRPPPAGFSEIEADLELLQERMRDAETESTEGKRRCEALWSVIRVNHQRSRYVSNLYKDNKISKELFDFLVKQGYADLGLISKWRKTGFESLCCLQCSLAEQHTKGGACICRVPAKDRKKAGHDLECKTCGCGGCASGDVSVD